MGTENLECCFCGADTRGVADVEYIELEVTFPVSDTMRQLFGAHAGCFRKAAAAGYPLANPTTGD